jgi:DNA repair protein RecN (Recombination protein N)
MLAELTIRDFVIIERLVLRFSPGFNVFTGETGAGKSIIIDAVSLLLGGRADSDLIRADSDVATVEGIFYLSPEERAAIDPLLAQDELQGDEPHTLVLSREIRHSGHNVCRVNGRAVRLRVLEEIGEHLVDIHGQSEHLSLLQERTHLDFLDRYGDLEDEREAFRQRVLSLRAVRRELGELLRSERESSRRADLLRYQIGEINAANLAPDEDTELTQERNRLANAEKLTEISHEVLLLLAEGGDEGSACIDLLGQAVRSLGNLARIDSQMEPYLRQAEELEYQLDDLARALRDYLDEIEFNPGRLNHIEERLALLHRLQRKYGDSIQEVLAFGSQAAQELERIEHSGERIAELQSTENRLLREIGNAGVLLSSHRREAGARLAEAVEAELNELKMEGAQFAVEVRWEPKGDGAFVDQPLPGTEYEPGRYAFDSSGLDRVAFLIAPNIGEPLKPMVKIASGGETSRLMLALKTALSRADRIPTLIFDEIDQGIGGRVGGIVGRKLLGLSISGEGAGRQVFCVTHLPQLAGYADVHMRVSKTVEEGRTKTVVDALDEATRISELAQMLGGESDSTRATAEQLLQRA